MRDIKFRAWNGKRMFINIQEAYDTLEEDSNIDVNCFNDYLTDDDYSVMQYTGLFDRNGVEIYEGDILRLKNSKGQTSNHQQVYWDNELAAFNWCPANDDSWPDDFTGFYDDYEVIGNIYENPELLK